MVQAATWCFTRADDAFTTYLRQNMKIFQKVSSLVSRLCASYRRGGHALLMYKKKTKKTWDFENWSSRRLETLAFRSRDFISRRLVSCPSLGCCMCLCMMVELRLLMITSVEHQMGNIFDIHFHMKLQLIFDPHRNPSWYSTLNETPADIRYSPPLPSWRIPFPLSPSQERKVLSNMPYRMQWVDEFCPTRCFFGCVV